MRSSTSGPSGGVAASRRWVCVVAPREKLEVFLTQAAALAADRVVLFDEVEHWRPTQLHAVSQPDAAAV